MFGEDNDVTPVDNDGISLANQTVILDNDDYNDDEAFVSIAEDMLDPNNPKLTYTGDHNEFIPLSLQQKFAGVPRSIRSRKPFTTLIHKLNGII
jgi:hypothetical protein